MEEIYLKARAKINLNLEVLEKRKDNYHNIESVFQKINLYDEIYIRKTKTNLCDLKTNIEELNNEENIIYKAYVKLKEKFADITGVEVLVNKKIPMQAGLAGGSTDCASFILGMNQLFDLKLSKKEIETIGKSLGADVVPCLYDKAVMAQGIGDIITEINTSFKYYILVIKPEISCNTKEMYKKLDIRYTVPQLHNSKEIIQALENNDFELLCKNLHNSFEEVVEQREIIENLKYELVKNGAKGNLMTGSGSCVFGIFENKKAAKEAYRRLKENYNIYFCISYNSKRGKKYDK